MKTAFLLSVFVMFGFLSVSAAQQLVDHFDDPELDEHVWDFCQADPELIGFGIEPGSGRTYLSLRIDEEREDPDTCTKAGEEGFLDEWGVLGANYFFETPSAQREGSEPACVRAEIRDGEPIAQRNELRFAQRALYPPVETETWYFITFKLQGYDGDDIPECGSARWVVGQWKYERMAVGSGGSPFLAQRFDNGVLHLTMEDNGCRCMIAKAGGDPDLMQMHQELTEPEPSRLERALPLECRYSIPAGKNARCQPEHLILKAGEQEDLSTLPDPKREWVEMAYRIRAGGPDGASVDVNANGRFIVRAEGDIDPHLPDNRVKFKIGHYRDKIPVNAELLLDELCVSHTPTDCASPPAR
jgi:hypothetical protein